MNWYELVRGLKSPNISSREALKHTLQSIIIY